MNLITAIETRTSIREFNNEPVDINYIKEIIRLEGYAPSVNNYQPWRFYVIFNKDLMERMVIEISGEIAKLPDFFQKSTNVTRPGRASLCNRS